MKKRIAALLLAALMLTGILASCVNRKPDNPGGSVNNGTGTRDDDWDFSRFNDINLPEGTVVNIMSRAYQRHANEITVETEDGKEPDDFILASVWKRQKEVEEILDVTIKNNKVEETDEHGGRTLIQSVVNGGDNTYDIYASSYYGSSILAADGLFLDLYNVKNLDTTREYWSQYYIDKSQIGKGLYTITGDLAVSATRFLFVTFFNKDLVKEYQINDPYKMVADGTWTYDTMLATVKSIYKDVNSDGERDENDFYGMGVNNYLGVDAYTSAFNIPTITINSDKQAEICLNYEKYADVVDKLYTLFWQTEGVLNKQDPDHLATLFSQNTLIFSQSWLYNCESYDMRDMASDYGIIPYPKYNEQQSEYYTFGHDQITIFAVPKTTSQADAAGAVLEVMSATSRSTVIDQYYEMALKGRYARDEESVQMLDMIRSNFLLDTGWIYCESTNLMSRMLRTLIEAKSKNFASFYQKYRESFEASVKDLNNAFAGLDEEN